MRIETFKRARSEEPYNRLNKQTNTAKMMKQIQAQLALIAVTTSALHLDLGTTEYNNCGFTDEFENCK